MDIAQDERSQVAHDRAGASREDSRPRIRHSYSATHSCRSSISNRRGIALNIPRFNQLPGARQPISLSPHPTRSVKINVAGIPIGHDGKNDSTNTHDTTHPLLRTHSLGPLTPPHDIDINSWYGNVQASTLTDAQHEATDHDLSREASGGSRVGFAVLQMPTSQLSSNFSISSQGLPDQLWLQQAFKSISEYDDASLTHTLLIPILGQGFENQSSPQYIELVSQVLPNHASDRRLVKTSELICDHLQQTLRDLQGITITHAIAVPQSQIVEDFPKSPPSTPNFRVANGYFDEPVVVTKAANVPIYHELPGKLHQAGLQIQRRIMVRSVVDVALLERWIPPTTASEITDFFDADSFRSYLADRLSELSLGNGSLLLIYPTRLGGQTFAKKYVAPILDPLLREMSILRGLDTDAAQKLGTMEAVESMLEFSEMKSRIEALCMNMSNRSRVSSVRSFYNIVHCQKAEVVLDKATWMTWYVEQEQQRMKQNLVEYHKDGGRLPLGDSGTSELTAGMLTREIIEGFQKSKNEGGNVGIEVGVFMVKRTRRQHP